MKKKPVIKMTKKQAIDEHTKLVKILKSGSKKNLAKEAKKQSKELKEYKKVK